MKTKFLYLQVVFPLAFFSVLFQFSSFQAAAAADTLAGEPIPWSEISAHAGGQYQGDGLSVVPIKDGAALRCVFQRLEGEATAEGLWLSSTVPEGGKDRFRLVTTAVGRQSAGLTSDLAVTGTVSTHSNVVHFIRSEVVEEYSVSMDGVRQDFIVEVPPINFGFLAEGNLFSALDFQLPGQEGELRIELAVSGARAEATTYGARLVLDNSGRKIAYSRLRVTDKTGRELDARMEVASANRIAVMVNDASAVYPVRIDPTFSDENWISMGNYPGANGIVLAAVVDDLGNLYIGGWFTVVGEAPANRIAKWDGNKWSPLGSGVNDVVRTLAVKNNDLYVGGSFTNAGSVSARNRIARWVIGGSDDNSWSALGSGVNDVVTTLAVNGNDLYVAGSFTNAGGVSGRNRIAKWAIGGSDDSSWARLGSGVSGSVRALAVHGNDLYVGGSFTNAGGVSGRNRIARWTIGGSDDSSWAALGSGVNDTVLALAVKDNDLYVGGNFTRAGGVSGRTPGHNRIAKWAIGGGDDSSWSALGSGVSYSAYALAMKGNELYVGGNFTSAGGISDRNYIAKWAVAGSDDRSWSAIGSGVGLNNRVYSAVIAGNDLYVGGSFTSAGGVAGRNYIAKWDGAEWTALGSGVNGRVRILLVNQNDLYVGGDFTSAGGVWSRNRIAKWVIGGSDDSSWSALGSGVSGEVAALAMKDNDLYVGGNFTSAGGVSGRNRIAKWVIGGSDDSSWSALGSGVSDIV